MKIIITNIAIFDNDAMGNDVLKEFDCLSSHGFEVHLYAEQFDAKYSSLLIDKSELDKLVKKQNTILIYHHGTYWPLGEEFINKAECRVYLKYHNVTPSVFFERYSDEMYESTRLGREQTKRMVQSGKICRYLPDSSFNGEELIEYGAERSQVDVLPPFHCIEEFAGVEITPGIVKELSDGKVNVLFVGRIAPNKGYEHLIEVIRHYRTMYDDNIRLNLVGGLDPRLDSYFNELIGRIDAYGLADFIHFRQKVSFRDLKSYYHLSDIFLLMSEHEGFCVPILEAQYNRMPIIALDRGAVRGTLGNNQILLEELDYSLFAAAINVLKSNENYKDMLIVNGKHNYLKCRDDICDLLIECIA